MCPVRCLRKRQSYPCIFRGIASPNLHFSPGGPHLRMNLIGNAAGFFGRLHLGLRGQILLLGVAGVLVVGAIYLAGLQVEERSQREAERFAALEGLTAKVSENLLQARETATQFMQKPTDK